MNTKLLTSFIALALTIGTLQAAEVDPSQAQWYAHYKKQTNIPQPNDMLLNKDAEPDLKSGFADLFNGEDLTGWTPKGGTCKYEVVDGTIVGTVVPKSSSTYLSTDNAEFTDFIFTCEMKWEVEGNSGVMFRAQAKPGKKNKVTVFGPQAEMEEGSKGRGWSGGIYGQSCGGWFYPLWLTDHAEIRKAQKKEGWNRLTIMAKGDVVKTWLNGVPAAHWVNDTYKQGFFALQIHAGSKGEVHWRGIRVKELGE